MVKKTLEKGAVIFYANDSAECMYDIFSGKVGIYAGYGTPNEKLIAELGEGDYFGEMGLLEATTRSATAVAMEDNTIVAIISKRSYEEYFKENPARMLLLMQQMSQRLRKTTEDYLEACNTMNAVVEKGDGLPYDVELNARLAALHHQYMMFNTMGIFLY